MKVKHNVSLKKYNTFGIEATAHHFLEIKDVDQLRDALQLEEYPEKFIISGGSNMLLTKDIEALVLHINMKGIELLQEDDEGVELKVMAGENWHKLVLWTLEKGYGGLQNLSLIPGNTGTAPIQNIGAYGVELKDVFIRCDAMEIATGKIIAFSKEACQFGYRDSFFKNEGKGKFIITAVYLRLSKKNHALNTSYGAIDEELAQNKTAATSIKAISDAVIAIRRKKLPDPEDLGNSGSFFKNPVLGTSAFQEFSKKHPDAPFYQISDHEYKVPAGWLIEQCGFKGKRFGDAGVHNMQALVLVNYGKASGRDVLALARRIQEEVYDKFAIKIQPEVNIIS